MKNKRKEAITMSNEWKIETLGFVANMYQPKTISQEEMIENGDYAVYGANGVIGRYDKYNHETPQLLVTCRGATCGTINISAPFSWITGNSMVIQSDSNVLDVDYLKYFLGQDKLMSQVITGAAQPQITRANLSLLKISFPKSLDRQREIAAVLDKASELVEKRKTQLAELDRLAESIFYDMFGDPVTNEKGWSHKTLSELGDWKSGGTPSRNNSRYFCGDTPWVSSGELNNMYIVDTNEHITEDAILNSNTKKIKVGSILLGMYDTAALKSSITKRIMCCNQAIAYSRLEDNVVDTLFVYTVIQICKDEYKKLQRGIRQKNLNLSMIKAISIIYPPLSLQQQFAERIEKIEEQKAKVKAALKESENLFQRLMQDMFNPEYHNS